jgi:hypothetical protein
MIHGSYKSVPVVHIDAIIVPKHLFVKVSEQVERLDRDVLCPSVRA